MFFTRSLTLLEQPKVSIPRFGGGITSCGPDYWVVKGQGVWSLGAAPRIRPWSFRFDLTNEKPSLTYLIWVCHESGSTGTWATWTPEGAYLKLAIVSLNPLIKEYGWESVIKLDYELYKGDPPEGFHPVFRIARDFCLGDEVEYPEPIFSQD